MKKIFLIIIYLLLFNSFHSFGQTPSLPIWTTVNGNIVKSIPISSVKSEVLKIANQYKYFLIEDISRNIYKTSFSSGGNGPLLKSWEANNQNYVFALQERTNLFGINIDTAQIFFVKGDRVYTIGFHQNSSALITNSIQNDKKYLEQLIDSYLNGMTINSNQTNTDNRPSFSIINKTGYAITDLYVTPSSADDIGNNLLNNYLPNGQTIIVRLGQQLNIVNEYNIFLIDINSDLYYKLDVIITSNASITFTFNDLDMN